MDSRSVFAFGLLWVVLTVYTVLSAVDFGAGFYHWLAGWRGRADVQAVTLRYLSPLWETTNVFLVLFFVGMVGFFPASARVFGTALLIPASLAVIALVVRGAGFAFSHVGHWGERVLVPVSAFAGLAVLPLLVAFVSSGEDGAIRLDARGAVVVSQARLWLSPLHLLLMALALALPLYLAPLVLSWYANRHNEPTVSAFYQRAARWSLAPIAALGLSLPGMLAWAAPYQARALLALWPLQLVAIALFGCVVFSVCSGAGRRTGLAAASGVGQLAGVLMVFGMTRLPFLLYPTLRVDAALTPPAMFVALSVTVGVGAAVLVPSLTFLYLLFLRPNTWLLPVVEEGVSDLPYGNGAEGTSLSSAAGVAVRGGAAASAAQAVEPRSSEGARELAHSA